jgi:hypothetical protein
VKVVAEVLLALGELALHLLRCLLLTEQGDALQSAASPFGKNRGEERERTR